MVYSSSAFFFLNRDKFWAPQKQLMLVISLDSVIMCRLPIDNDDEHYKWNNESQKYIGGCGCQMNIGVVNKISVFIKFKIYILIILPI